jgi:hypothetical protein
VKGVEDGRARRTERSYRHGRVESGSLLYHLEEVTQSADTEECGCDEGCGLVGGVVVETVFECGI